MWRVYCCPKLALPGSHTNQTAPSPPLCSSINKWQPQAGTKQSGKSPSIPHLRKRRGSRFQTNREPGECCLSDCSWMSDSRRCVIIWYFPALEELHGQSKFCSNSRWGFRIHPTKLQHFKAIHTTEIVQLCLCLGQHRDKRHHQTATHPTFQWTPEMHSGGTQSLRNQSSPLTFGEMSDFGTPFLIYSSLFCCSFLRLES